MSRRPREYKSPKAKWAHTIDHSRLRRLWRAPRISVSGRLHRPGPARSWHRPCPPQREIGHLVIVDRHHLPQAYAEDHTVKMDGPFEPGYGYFDMCNNIHLLAPLCSSVSRCTDKRSIRRCRGGAIALIRVGQRRSRTMARHSRVYSSAEHKLNNAIRLAWLTVAPAVMYRRLGVV